MSITSPSFHTQVGILGAGVVGLAIARRLALAGKEVLIFEKESSFGSITSARNSEVIHAGIYYPHKSKKAELCLKGKQMLYQYCQERKIAHKQLGKLIVATDQEQVDVDLPRIIKHASNNGVNDLQLLSGEDVKQLEPEVTCKAAILSPSTGIVDSHTYMLNLLGDAEEHGAVLALNSAIEKVSLQHNKIVVESSDMTIGCDIFVNCAGLVADLYANMVDSNLPRQYFAKGNYYRLEGQRTPFQHLIYPVPAKGGLGVHATIDLGSNCRFGPDVEWLSEDLRPQDIDYTVDPQRSKSFYREVRKYWPNLKDGVLQPDYSGCRPKLGHPNLKGSQLNADFFIEKIPGTNFINLLGIESPGLTASMSIAEMVHDMIGDTSRQIP